MRVAAVVSILLFGALLAQPTGAAKEKTVAKKHVVKMLAMSFDPPTLMDVKVGDQVEFVNNSGGSHTATSDDIGDSDPDKTFNTGVVKSGQTAIINVNEAKTYSYNCFFHKNMGMKGKIVVK